jgi:hypothetical protein
LMTARGLTPDDVARMTRHTPRRLLTPTE